MKKILFLNDFYYPKPLPNAVCLHKVALELLKMDYEVHVIAYRQRNSDNVSDYQGVKIHYISPRLFYKLRSYGQENIKKPYGNLIYKIAKGINKIAKFIYLPWFPLASPTTVFRYYKKSQKLHKSHNFNGVVALFNPDDTLFAGVLLKRKFPELKFGAYILDSLIYLSGKKLLPPFLREKLSWKFESLIYSTADMVYNFETHKVHHTGAKYEAFRDKITFLDTPLFEPKLPVFTNSLFDADKKHLVYMGTLFKSFRNPEYMYRLFNHINATNEYQLHFYTRGDMEDRVIRYQDETGGTVIRHGFVPHSEIDNINANADFLINLGVSNSTNNSSKIFDFMSIGKPIIHFYYFDDDVNLRYFEKYELSLMIKMDDNLFEENALRLNEFLIKNYGKTINTEKLTETFYKNLPAYTAKEFDKLTGKA